MEVIPEQCVSALQLMETDEGADGTSINTNPLIYTCEVGTRREDDIKRKGRQQRGEEEKEKHWNIL